MKTLLVILTIAAVLILSVCDSCWGRAALETMDDYDDDRIRADLSPADYPPPPPPHPRLQDYTQNMDEYADSGNKFLGARQESPPLLLSPWPPLRLLSSHRFRSNPPHLTYQPFGRITTTEEEKDVSSSPQKRGFHVDSYNQALTEQRSRPYVMNLVGSSPFGGGGGRGRHSSSFLAPVSPRKRQILFRQCFFNPISCF